MSVRLTRAQRAALEAVAAGRVQYGSEWPSAARRLAASGNTPSSYAFLVDGHSPDGSAKATLPSLEERGLVRVRHEDVETYTVPERVAEYRTITGVVRRTIPSHDEPVDAGWRAAVELTPAGREASR